MLLLWCLALLLALVPIVLLGAWIRLLRREWSNDSATKQKLR